MSDTTLLEAIKMGIHLAPAGQGLDPAAKKIGKWVWFFLQEQRVKYIKELEAKGEPHHTANYQISEFLDAVFKECKDE